MQTAAALVNHLKQEIEWVQALNTLLDQERELLIAAEYHALEAISIEKTALSDRLEQSARTRMQLMNPQNLQTDPKKVLQDFLAFCTREAVENIQIHNRALAEKLLICDELNKVNGQVIAANMHRRQALLDSLKGADTLNVYTAVGQVKSSTGNNHYQEV